MTGVLVMKSSVLQTQYNQLDTYTDRQKRPAAAQISSYSLNVTWILDSVSALLGLSDMEVDSVSQISEVPHFECS